MGAVVSPCETPGLPSGGPVPEPRDAARAFATMPGLEGGTEGVNQTPSTVERMTDGDYSLESGARMDKPPTRSGLVQRMR